MKKPIVPVELYRGIRDSQLVGLSGYSKEVAYYSTISTLFEFLFLISLTSAKHQTHMFDQLVGSPCHCHWCGA